MSKPVKGDGLKSSNHQGVGSDGMALEGTPKNPSLGPPQSKESDIIIPDAKVVAENLRSAKARDSIQLCPSCQRPNKMRSTPITLGTPNEAIVGFQLVVAQECVYCGKQMIAMFQSCRPNYRKLFRFACKQALENDDMTIPWEGD